MIRNFLKLVNRITINPYGPCLRPQMGILVGLAWFALVQVVCAAETKLEFATGRPQPLPEGTLMLGSGLAMSGGYLQGVPLGELPGWTASLWFQPRSSQRGELFNLVFNRDKDEVLRLIYDEGYIQLSGPSISGRAKREMPDGWQFQARLDNPDEWHQVFITYSQENGPTLYLDGKLIGSGERHYLGYATPFNDYHFGAGISAGGEMGNYFDGLIDDFVLYPIELTSSEVKSGFQDNQVFAPVVAFNDFENVNHRKLARFSASDRDEAYLKEGRKLYELHCIACHSKDGITPPINPLARAFTKHEMGNGGDPLNMFKTLTYGFRNMMPSPQLNPEQRYQVIHYIRENLIRQHAPELYVEVKEDYTEPMPVLLGDMKQEAARIESLAKVGYLRDYGRALIAPVQGPSPENSSRNALVIDLGSTTTIGYDLGTMRSIGVWQGGFLDFSNTLHHKLRAPGQPITRFDFLPGLDAWEWAWNGQADNEPPKLKPNAIYPEEQIRYRGHYPYGDDIIVSYTVQNRGVLECPSVQINGDEPTILRHLSIEPGNDALELVVLNAEGVLPIIDGQQATLTTDGKNVCIRLSGNANGLKLRKSGSGDVVLQIPSSETPLHFSIAFAEDPGSMPSVPVVNLLKRTHGGPSRWNKTHTMAGKLSVSRFQGYVLDSLPVPLKNNYNTWMRTSSLTFFPDGRLAVSTLSGDIWLVTGIDKGLDEVTWQRFAAGLYEPMGMKVIDGILTVCTRGRIVKLHDYNADGEADYYEAFHNEEEPSPGWHAYSFDLEVGEDGSLYYARVGGFSDWSIPGGLVRVSADGKSSHVVSAGMRVPNGIGRLPDGRITFGDNQGTYVPASKISIASIPDTFHGAGKWTEREGDYDPEKILAPIVYMPQELDSSSGAQLWVPDDERFGPLSRQYYHTSYGRASTMYVMIDEFDDIIQGAVFTIPVKMESGTMRVAKNPADGQLYYSGLTGWQAGATREGSIQRLRYTGEEGLYLLSAKARAGRLELSFNQPIDPASIKKLDLWQAKAWNYQWSSKYGSPHFKVTEPGTEGVDLLQIDRLELSKDGCSVLVHIPQLQPCHTLKLNFTIDGKSTHSLSGPLYFTIHQLPE